MNRKKSKEILARLRERFLEGEKLTVETIIKDHFKPSSPYAYLIAKTKTRGWLGMLKGQIKFNHGLWFGNLDETGRYGVISTEEEVRFALIKYYRHIKGSVNSAGLLMGNADKLDLLPEGLKKERMLVARIDDDDDKN